jgi:signal transduction histidine kinase
MTLGPVNIDGLVRQLIHERPELSPPRAEIAIERALAAVIGHEATLSQCLTNLLSNAVKFVSPGAVPRVQVWTEEFNGPAGEGNASAIRPPWVRLWVEDQGIGIAPEAQDRIFEIFQRLHSSMQYEGSGIGLAIVRKGSERMGGRVGVDSAPGKGSRFCLELLKA